MLSIFDLASYSACKPYVIFFRKVKLFYGTPVDKPFLLSGRVEVHTDDFQNLIDPTGLEVQWRRQSNFGQNEC